jgi:hypothetical protein
MFCGDCHRLNPLLLDDSHLISITTENDDDFLIAKALHEEERNHPAVIAQRNFGVGAVHSEFQSRLQNTKRYWASPSSTSETSSVSSTVAKYDICLFSCPPDSSFSSHLRSLFFSLCVFFVCSFFFFFSCSQCP